MEKGEVTTHLRLIPETVPALPHPPQELVGNAWAQTRPHHTPLSLPVHIYTLWLLSELVISWQGPYSTAPSGREAGGLG